MVAGEGMPIYHLTGQGNLFVEYQVVLPPALTPKQREGELGQSAAASLGTHC